MGLVPYLRRPFPCRFSISASLDSPRKRRRFSHSSYLPAWLAKNARMEEQKWRRSGRWWVWRRRLLPPRVAELGDVHLGFASSHFFLRFLQVRQPVLDRPLVILLVETTGVRGCLRGLPRGRFAFGWADVGLVLLGTGVGGASLISSRRMSSSMGSTLGTATPSSDPCSQCMSWSPTTCVTLTSSALSP